MNFNKYIDYLKKKLEMLCFEDENSHGSKMYNLGVKCMHNYALIAILQAESDFNEEQRKKVSE
jgi:hypothetical protein